jgi:hypothetical protein
MEAFHTLQIKTNVVEGCEEKAVTDLSCCHLRPVNKSGNKKDLYPSEYDLEMIKDELLAS